MADEMGEMGELDEVEGGRQEPRSSVASFTWHARRRGARRNVAPDAVDYVLAHGRMIQRTGVMFYFLGWRDIPPRDRRASWASRLEGSIVIVASDGAVITIYRNRRGLRTIARKAKYQLDARNHSDAREATAPTTMMARASA
ncbi:MAG TPA: hypothetical protein VFS83_01785 [Ktedonobacterales bacterium]|nr:hypothetical protein [Ktedonobacterales bacterium]